MGYILAFDVGTTAIKAVCVNRSDRSCYSAKTDCALYRPAPDMAEQDPEELWRDLCIAGKNAIANAGITADVIDGVVISAPWKHIILMDAEDRIIRPSLIWMDARAGEQAERLNAAHGSFVGSGNCYWARLMWLKEHEPEAWKRAEHIVGLNTYFKYRATGVFATEPSDDFIHSYDPDLQAYIDRILSLAGVSEEERKKFPAYRRCTELVGGLCAKGAEELGLNEGTPVFGGFGDLVAVSVGSGCVKPGAVHIYIGTSSWLSLVCHDRSRGIGNDWFTQDIGLESSIASLTTAGKAYEWAIDRFFSKEKAEMGDDVFAYVDNQISQIPAGSDGLIVTHWLNGENPRISDSTAGALFFNVTEHHDKRYFVRAMAESICYSHRCGLERLSDVAGRPDSVTVVGGGALNSTFMQIMADVLGVRVHVPDNPRFIGTLGSVYCAEVGLGTLTELPEVTPGGGRDYFPDPDHKKIYEKMYRVYRTLYPALKDSYVMVNR